MLAVSRLWGVIKEEVRKRLMERQADVHPMDKDEFGDLVIDACYDMANKHWRKLINANESYIARCLSNDPI